MSTGRHLALFFQPFPVVAQAELASALRRNGVRVELVVERLPGRVWKLQRLLDRVVFQKIHYLLTADGEVTPELIELTGGPDTEDIQAYDQIAAELAKTFSDRGEPVPSGLLPECWYDKWWMARRLSELGVPSPRVWREPVTDQFPVVVKLPVSSGGLGVRVVHSETELARAWEEFSAQGDPFLQQYLAGEGVSVTGVAHEGAVIAAVMYLQHKDPADPYGPSLQQQVLSPKDSGVNEILTNASRVIKDSGYSGPFSIQVILDDEGVGLITDYNPRVVGAWASLEQAGAELLQPTVQRLQPGFTPPASPVVTLQHGTGTSMRLTFDSPWTTWQDGQAWLGRTTAQLWQRRNAVGWRFSVWGAGMTVKLGAQQTKELRFRRRHMHHLAADSSAYQVQVVCLGNICRSPMAEAILQQKFDDAGLHSKVRVTSSGTSRFNAGKDMDPRARTVLEQHGYTATHQSRTINPDTVGSYDLILVMDHENLNDVTELTNGAPANIRLFSSFDPNSEPNAEVPDPYRGTSQDFEEAFTSIERASTAIVDAVRAELLASLPAESVGP